MVTAAAYIRVSTDDQLEYSPDSQLEKIREYAKQNNMLLPEEYIYREKDGVSGRSADKRPEFQRMIATARKKEPTFETILVWKYSRFARNQEESVVYKSLLKKERNINVVSVSEPLIEGEFGNLIERIIEWMDGYYSIRLAGEVKRGMNEKAMRGGVVTIPSFGYKVEDGQYVPNEKEAAVIRMIFDDFLAGVTTWDIARKINAMGIRTHRGNNWDKRGIDYILQNPIYIGKIRWNPDGKTKRGDEGQSQKVIDSPHEPLISMGTWEESQNRIAELKKMYAKHSRKTRLSPYMLQGLVYCDTCGKTLARCMASGENHGMQCTGYVHGTCTTSHYINMNTIKDMVVNGLQSHIIKGDYTLKKKNNQPSMSHAELIEKQVGQEEQKLKRVKEAYAAGIDTLDEYKDHKDRITATIAKLKEAIPHDEPTPEERNAFIHKCKDVLELIKDNSVDEETKNMALRSIIDKILFSRARTDVDLFFYC